MIYLKSLSKCVIIFAIASALAYGFGFHLLFTHTAMEAFYWGAYYLGSYILGSEILSRIFN